METKYRIGNTALHGELAPISKHKPDTTVSISSEIKHAYMVNVTSLHGNHHITLANLGNINKYGGSLNKSMRFQHKNTLVLTKTTDGCYKSLEFYDKCPEFHSKRPELYNKCPEFYIKCPEFCSKRPEFYNKRMEFYSKRPELYSKCPEVHSKRPELYTERFDVYRESATRNKVTPYLMIV